MAQDDFVSEIFDPTLWQPVTDYSFTDITYHRARDVGAVRIAFHRPEVRNAFRPRTVDELYTSLKAHYPDIGLTTVYRTLDLLVDLGVITRVHADDGTARYGIRRPGISCVVELVCEVCGDRREVELDQLQPLLQAAAAEAEMALTNCSVRLDGICSRCQRKQELPSPRTKH